MGVDLKKSFSPRLIDWPLLGVVGEGVVGLGDKEGEGAMA
ncbi:hypothetical protein CWATWH0401_3245 [Crocosphaera watsonii WH 0401]|uniref:Uncharacterized protein n=2 Tax=Crocosphaera watsonii TaxID=263511 RepID=T2IRG6_CROWT|nr:hypothetical protein CWATWH0005_4567 [Crocosphaera watsonii WH 0005]CCQ63045.1 hypothetical protein CWATWH0401_3245 [Crocosphaera watsonii WH 0401]